MRMIIFDLESAPLPDAELLAMLPPFDQSEVKCGNLGPEKAAEKIAAAKASYEKDFIDGAALDPMTGRVLVIGKREDGEFSFYERDEMVMLFDFWLACECVRNHNQIMVGFNIFQFDLPFLIKRSWKLGVKVPSFVRQGRYWSDSFIDLRDVWQMGDRQAKGSLDAIAKHFCLGGKTGNGKDFAKLFATDKKAALSYLENDLLLTAKIAERMGVA